MKFNLQSFGTGKRKGLWLHGWLGSAEDGRELQKHLGGAFQLICPDLPGHGDTPLLGAEVEQTLKEISELAESCHWAGGYSMGGRLLMMAAEKYPRAFHRLLIESASLGLQDEEKRRKRLQLDRQRAAELKNRGLNAFCEDWYRMEMWGGLKTLPERVGDKEELAGALERFSLAQQPDLRPWVISAPQQILWLAGRRDRKYAEQAEWMRGNAPHQVVLFDAGHNVHLQQPEEWAARISDFLQKDINL